MTPDAQSPVTPPPTMGTGPWPTCCGRPMFFGPRGYSCVGHREPLPGDGGLFPAPARQTRRLAGDSAAPRARVVVAQWAGVL